MGYSIRDRAKGLPAYGYSQTCCTPEARAQE